MQASEETVSTMSSAGCRTRSSAARTPVRGDRWWADRSRAARGRARWWARGSAGNVDRCGESFPRPLRLALFEEGPHAFLEVAARIAERDQIAALAGVQAAKVAV